MMRGGMRTLVESCLLLTLVFTTLIALLKLFTKRGRSPNEAYVAGGSTEGAVGEGAWSRRPAFLPSIHGQSTHGRGADE